MLNDPKSTATFHLFIVGETASLVRSLAGWLLWRTRSVYVIGMKCRRHRRRRRRHRHRHRETELGAIRWCAVSSWSQVHLRPHAVSYSVTICCQKLLMGSSVTDEVNEMSRANQHQKRTDNGSHHTARLSRLLIKCCFGGCCCFAFFSPPLLVCLLCLQTPMGSR